MHAPSNANDRPWQHFTVLDAMLLQLAYALAFSMVFVPLRAEMTRGFDVGSLLGVLIAACLGSLLAGPIVLSSHWLFRGRQASLSAGEWLWLSPIALFLTGLVGVCLIYWIALDLPDRQEVQAVFLVFLALSLLLVEAGLVLNALLVLLARWGNQLPQAPCGWTDRFGAVSCLAAGIVTLLIALAVFA